MRDDWDDRGLRETIKSRPFKNQDGLMSPLSGDGGEPASTEVTADGDPFEEMMHLKGPRPSRLDSLVGRERGRDEVREGCRQAGREGGRERERERERGTERGTEKETEVFSSGLRGKSAGTRNQKNGP